MKNSFDEMASSFDTDYRADRALKVARAIKEKMALAKKPCALEFGCGTGLVTVNLIDAVQTITLVDTSQGMLSVLKNKILEKHYGPEVITSDSLFSAGLPENTFDFIYSSMALHHVSALDPYLKRFYDLLKPQGQLCIVDFSPLDELYHKSEPDFNGHHGFDPQKLSRQFQKYGFVEEANEIFYNDSRVIEDRIVAYSLFILALRRR